MAIRTLEPSGSRAVFGRRQPRPPTAPGTPLIGSSTFRRWFIATTVGELVAFSVPTAVWGLTAGAGLDERWALVPVIAGGAVEGAILGYAQTLALRHDLPALDVKSWVRVTAAAGALGWAVGMVPSTFHEALSELPVPVLVVLGAASGVVLLCSIGVAQATVVRRHVEHAPRWVWANALGWLAGLPVVFLANAVAPYHPAGLRAAFAVAGGVGMGATVGAVTGAFLVRLLRRPRAGSAQPLRRRARVHINHADGWLYAHSGGRLGGRLGDHRVLLLTTTGRRTGRPRRTPVQYETVDGNVLLVAAGGGAPQPPAWWRNIEADPQVRVQIGGHPRVARAATLSGAERDRLWPRLSARNRYLDPLQAKARREFPVVRLDFEPSERVGGGS